MLCDINVYRPHEDMNGKAFMEAALLLAAEAAADGEVPVGAVIVRDSDGMIAGTGRNTREKSRCSLGHAELAAISEASAKLGGWRLEGCTMYVTLEPCPMCAGAAINARLSGIVFGAYDKKAGACGSVTDLFSAGFASAAVVSGGFMEDECSALLKKFFSDLRKKRGKFRISDAVTQDQLSRASEMSGLSPAELAEYSRICFIRKKSVPIGLKLGGNGAEKVIIFDRYKNNGIITREEAEKLAENDTAE